MEILLSLSISLIVGLLLSRLTKKLDLPAVTAYLVAGIIVGPYCLGSIGIAGLGFSSMEFVHSFSIVCDVALGFIAFSIGNEFRLSHLKKIGRQATIVGIFQAVVTTLVVDIALIALHFAIPEVLTIEGAIILGAIASATAPAATLMVVKQYKAKGPVTDMLLPVVALDDAVGLIIFAISFGIARAMNKGTVDLISVLVEPLLEVILSLLLGSVMGVAFHICERFFHSNSKRISVSIGFVLLTIALSQMSFEVMGVHIAFSSLLTCMMLGTIFCNICDFSEELMERVDKWTAPLFVLFFVLSGAELELGVFSNLLMVVVGIVYIIARSAGKYSGAYVSAKISGCDEKIVKYLGITLFPQAGVALGMAMKAKAFGEIGDMVSTITLFAVLIYELVGPALTKTALLKAGDIDPEKRRSARHAHVENMPEHKKERHFRRQALKDAIKNFIKEEKESNKKQ
ncbi:MAG: cation:proton antiporter [Clostridia bacterium]|nr:cation:proton antiporter [Clostridia bacterium]